MATSRSTQIDVKGPLGILSLLVGVLGAVVGYILTMLGVTLYFDLNQAVSLTDTGSLVVVATGLGALVVAYLGWRGFIRFAY